MKVEIKGIESTPIVSNYARIGVTESSSVGYYEIHFEKVGRCGLNANVIKTEDNGNVLISRNRNIDVLGRKLEFVEKIVDIIATESMRRAMSGNPNGALNHVSSWLDFYFNNGGELDDDLIKIICKTIGEI